MLRSTRAISIVIAFSALQLAGCSTFGPKADVSVVGAEVKATSAVDNIIVVGATGIDVSGNTGKALLGAALSAYGARSRPLKVASSALDAMGAPAGLGDVIGAPYQAAFAKVAEQHMKKGGDAPTEVKLDAGVAIKGDLDGAKELVGSLKADAAAIGELNGALKAGDSARLSAALGKSAHLMGAVRSLDGALFHKLSVTYVLVTHVLGSEADWKAGKKCSMAIGLVNVKTGKLRYYATTHAEKSLVPVPYMAQLGTMSSSLFDAVESTSPLPEAKKKQKT